MNSYLKDIYAKDEYSEELYPQKLCNFLFQKYLIGKNIDRGTLLDIGSGKGNQLVGFSRNNFECYGIDKREECVEILDNFEIRECDLESEKLPFDDNYFDVVFTKSVIEHVFNTDHFIKEAKRVLKVNGTLIVLTPDWESQSKSFFDDYTHIKPFTKKGLKAAISQNGFKDVYCDYFLQLPFVWKYPLLSFIPKALSFLPYSWRFSDKEQKKSRVLIRFSQEKMLLAVATK
ncbi:class I SAM-dependent methyltransferase [bacterium]|jgi:ubiquinone/menaquinone biosynthesis C-methylase UbiE|nr:class I SAM-dependent methyltransferase [bacterium]